MTGMQETQHCEAPKDREQKERPRSPLSGAPLPLGRQKGTPNKVTRTIREAVERAAAGCHPQGLAGWLIERANGGVQDRQIFAGLVAKALPLQVAHNVNGGITIAMPWLAQRGVASVAQIQGQHAQVLDITDVPAIEHRINDASDQAQGVASTGAEGAGGQARATPHPPVEPGAGGG
jgi:hypothetical protein